MHFPDPIDLSCWKARLNKLVTAEGVGSSGKQAPNPVFYKGDYFGPHQKKTQLISKLEVFEFVYIYNQISVIDVLIDNNIFLVIIHPDSRIA